MDKLTMAHEWAMQQQRMFGINLVTEAKKGWEYADAMQAEAEKREPKGFPDPVKMASFPTVMGMQQFKDACVKPRKLIEGGQHFDDVCSDEIQAQRDAELYGTGFLKVTYDSNGVKYERLDPKTISIFYTNIGADSKELKEWQPDWSQAPDWADYWCIDAHNRAFWFNWKPYSIGGMWKLSGSKEMEAPTFKYQGDWKDSLRERPE